VVVYTLYRQNGGKTLDGTAPPEGLDTVICIINLGKAPIFPVALPELFG
jgi:hypothetical protein